MTILELRDLLNKEIKKGKGSAEVGYISCIDPCLCSISKEDCGFYTETWYTIHADGTKEPRNSTTCYVIGNLINANEAKNDE